MCRTCEDVLSACRFGASPCARGDIKTIVDEKKISSAGAVVSTVLDAVDGVTVQAGRLGECDDD
ncbi:MAG: hypothetical protein ACK4IT_08935 [Thioalkalivibrionaceae bacterium]